MTRFAMIGFGEVGALFARDLHRGGAAELVAYDTDDLAMARAGATRQVSPARTAREAALSADVVFVAVTAGTVIDAVTAMASGLGTGSFVVDVNSVSPATKRQAAAIVTAHGGRYVEAAVMAAVSPHGLRTPMLLGGPHAAPWSEAMAAFDLRVEVLSREIGPASAVKMCRSVMIKGLEALATECMLTARRNGVHDRVLASLSETLPHSDWPALARYLIGRSLTHGKRRSEEMRQVAATVGQAGFEPLLSLAIAERQRWAGDQGRRLTPAALAGPGLAQLLDALIELEEGRPPPDDAERDRRQAGRVVDACA